MRALMVVLGAGDMPELTTHSASQTAAIPAQARRYGQNTSRSQATRPSSPSPHDEGVGGGPGKELPELRTRIASPSAFPLIPAFSPTGGEGARRADEGVAMIACDQRCCV